MTDDVARILAYPLSCPHRSYLVINLADRWWKLVIQIWHRSYRNNYFINVSQSVIAALGKKGTGMCFLKSVQTGTVSR